MPSYISFLLSSSRLKSQLNRKMASLSDIRSPSCVPNKWREAASLIIVCPTAKHQKKLKPSFAYPRSVQESLSPHGHPLDDELPLKSNLKLIELSQDYDILMLKRSGKSKFLPNASVFPGGVGMDNDFSSKWLNVFGKLGKSVQQQLFHKLTIESAVSAPMCGRQRDAQFSHIPAEVAFRLCAIRETFEESGVLIAGSANQIHNLPSVLSAEWTYSPSSVPYSSQLLKTWRERVNKNSNEFLSMCQDLDIIPAIWTLHEWSNWLVPKPVPWEYRFDTMFYICCLNYKPEICEDTTETILAKWSPPSTILSEHIEGKIIFQTPQVYEHSRFLNFQSHLDLMKFAAQREPEGVEQWLPIVLLCKDFHLLLLPGDDLYPKDPKVSHTVPFLESDKTFEELCQEFPHHNRNFRVKGNGIEVNESRHYVYHTSCNVPPARGHITPLTKLEA